MKRLDREPTVLEDKSGHGPNGTWRLLRRVENVGDIYAAADALLAGCKTASSG